MGHKPQTEVRTFILHFYSRYTACGMCEAVAEEFSDSLIIIEVSGIYCSTFMQSSASC